MGLKLYTYFRSSCAYRVRIILNHKGLDYDAIPVHLLNDGGEQHKQDYKKLNPSAQVPTLIDEGLTLGQSMAIAEYLEESYPQKPLLPEENKERAIVRQMCEVINSGIQPLQNLSVTLRLKEQFDVTDEQKKQWLQYWVGRGFESFHKLLEQHSGQFCFGDQITLADTFLAPQMFSSSRFGINLNSFPKLTEINNRLMELPEFIKASPSEQPDAPSD